MLVLTAVLAAVHLTTREQVPENTVRVTRNGKTTYLDVSDLDKEAVQGTIVNGKGKEITIDARGLPLAKALEKAHVDASAVQSVTVTARDEFSAEVSGEEVRQAGKAYLLCDEEGAVLVVFGDANAKRNVRQVERIDVQ